MRRGLSTIIIIVVLLAAAGGIYAFLQRAQESSDNAVNTSTARQEGAEQAAQSNSPSQSSNSTASQTNEVEIENFAFSPATITVKKGTTVKWTNKDATQHNVVSSQSGGPDGPLLKKGETYTFTFNTTGTFDYICEPHPTMKGKVVVTE